MATYRIDGVAQQEIDQIWDYYYGAANEIAANRRISRLYESFRLLSENPYMGVARPKFRPDARSHVVPGTPYIILYYPRPYGVEIARVVDGRQELPRAFREN